MEHKQKVVAPEEILALYRALRHREFDAASWILSELNSSERTDLIKLLVSSPLNDNLWVVREWLRLQHGEYVRVDVFDYSAQRLITTITAKRPLFFVHVSKEDPLQVAYTPSPEYGRADRQVRTTIGKLLKKIDPDLSDTQLKLVSDAWKATYSTDDVKWATSADDIERIYLDGPPSCMSYDHETGVRRGDDDRKAWGSQFHPVRIYADTPGVKMAYLERDGHVSARCLVFETDDEKRYIRNYGDALLESKLLLLGYKHGNLLGARLPKIQALDQNGKPLQDTWICPYIDDKTGNAAQSVRVLDDCLLVTRAECDVLPATYTNGLTGTYANYTRDYDWEDDDDDDDTVTCDCCGDSTHIDDSEYSEYHETHLCSHCASNHYTYAIYTRHRHATLIENDRVTVIDGEYYLNYDNLLTDLGFVYTINGEWRHRSDCQQLNDDDWAPADECFVLEDEYGVEKWFHACDALPSNEVFINLDEGDIVFQPKSDAILNEEDGWQSLENWLLRMAAVTEVLARRGTCSALVQKLSNISTYDRYNVQQALEYTLEYLLSLPQNACIRHQPLQLPLAA